jgi:hypothetical protein
LSVKISLRSSQPSIEFLGKWSSQALAVSVRKMGEELDDEKVIIHSTHLTREVVVLQPNTGIRLTVVFDNVIRCLEMLREACVMHVALECLGPWPLEAEAMPLSVIVSVTMLIMRGFQSMRPHPPMCLMVTLRMSFNWQYTLSTLST